MRSTTNKSSHRLGFLRRNLKNWRIQNRAIRWVSGIGPREPTSISQIRQDLKWPTLEKRRQNIRLTYMYKIIYKDIAVHPEHLVMQQSDSRTRAKHKYKMRELPARTDDLKHSFINRTIPQWSCLPASVTPGTLMTSAADDVINHNGRKIGRFKPIRFCYARMMSAQSFSRRYHWFWADVILADFQRAISRYLQDISTYLSCTAQRV